MKKNSRFPCNQFQVVFLSGCHNDLLIISKIVLRASRNCRSLRKENLIFFKITVFLFLILLYKLYFLIYLQVPPDFVLANNLIFVHMIISSEQQRCRKHQKSSNIGLRQHRYRYIPETMFNNLYIS